MSYDPKKQECHGLYLYGSGYFAQEDQRKAIVTAQHAASFCNECPRQKSCFEAHRKRMASQRPAEVERFERDRRAAERKGIGGALFAATRMKAGDPDPFMAGALVNFKRGEADHAREAAA